MKRILASDLLDKIGRDVLVSGWVHNRRDHGNIIFIDLRDSSGILQVVIIPGTKAYKKIKSVRKEWVLKIFGKVNARPKNMINKDINTGTIELEAKDIEILNTSKTTPFEIDKDTKNVDEEIRLKYRYLDLRTDRMVKNIRLRDKVIKFIRDYLHKRDFKEIETPFLTKSTPEGAREYIVPSRIYPGEFYVLPQSPQQFKQLLMIAGIEKYFQIAKCFRDEDQRSDRQPEFTQLDLEMSFVTQEEILNLIEDMMIKLIKNTVKNFKITNEPFIKITYEESIKKYKSDKPDLRLNKNDKTELSFVWIVDMPLFKYSNEIKKLVSAHHPFTMPNEKDMHLLDKEPEKVRAYAYDLVLNGVEIASGSIRIHKKDVQNKIFDILGVSKEEKQRRFGHMLEAFEYGAPPHGGIAPGLDRLIATLANEDVIREVIAFPKTGDARDMMMGAPSRVSEQQLKDVHILLAKEASGKEIKGSETKIND